MGSGISPYKDTWVMGAQAIKCLSSGWVARPTEVCIWFRRLLASAQMSILGPLPHLGQVFHMSLLCCHAFQHCLCHSTAYNWAAQCHWNCRIWRKYDTLIARILWIGLVERTKKNCIWHERLKHDTPHSTWWAQLETLQDSGQYELYWEYSMAVGTMKTDIMEL